MWGSKGEGVMSKLALGWFSISEANSGALVERKTRTTQIWNLSGHCTAAVIVRRLKERPQKLKGQRGGRGARLRMQVAMVDIKVVEFICNVLWKAFIWAW